MVWQKAWQWVGRGLVPILIAALVFPPNASGQQPEKVAGGSQSLPMIQSLKIVALAGSNEQNDLERKVMAPLVVQVLDQNDRAVEGAEVIFRFPLNGASATFADNKNSHTFRTNADGQAAATGWTANGQMGTLVVQVSASRGGEIGTASVTMVNATHVVSDGKVKHKRWWSTKTGKIVIAGAVAAGVTIGVILATRGKSTTTVTAVPGAPTIGGPQ